MGRPSCVISLRPRPLADLMAGHWGHSDTGMYYNGIHHDDLLQSAALGIDRKWPARVPAPAETQRLERPGRSCWPWRASGLLFMGSKTRHPL